MDENGDGHVGMLKFLFVIMYTDYSEFISFFEPSFEEATEVYLFHVFNP